MDQTGKIAGLYKELQRQQRAAALTKQSTLLPPQFRIEHCDLRDLKIPPNTADLILTDPPYDHDSVPLYGVLAEHAAQWLKPGGICLAYAGQLYLSEIIKLMREHLEWLWCFSVVHRGPVLTMRTTNFRQCWNRSWPS